ncbi:ribosome biogenesis protein SLX9-domain-containing protein [Fusarium flagelliforme]|uniref:Ribosome biogenesis protein SLX9 n=1 Tax=Fusarium flagelliforme TaxID=2675880 RepID=A0A395MQM1_9HYPO|nr:ribosome biogenesis protein SLX9-domain-containing protein [Fusarium flagelliforme]KAH7189542.1 ribosome biogenesis protein SLX9-domain-containing protein [Fusarium flagelliforme]RFN50110.1 hypothetical protein FIE12Z_5638 [Fusarium flagelliforme]
MAPQPPGLKKPSARTLRHQRVTGQIHPQAPQKVFRDDAAVTDDFLSTKRDKRLIKHSSFVSRIQSARISKSAKRRRPSKKLATTLDSLADALPELEEADAEQQGKIRHKSLKSKRGALKRKERVVKGEMERFGVNMATLAAQQEKSVGDEKMAEEKKDTPAPAPTANRWAALRGFISSTMEQNPAFAEKQ